MEKSTEGTVTNVSKGHSKVKQEPFLQAIKGQMFGQKTYLYPLF